MRTVMALSLISTGSPFWRMLISYTDSRPSSSSFQLRLLFKQALRLHDAGVQLHTLRNRFGQGRRKRRYFHRSVPRCLRRRNPARYPWFPRWLTSARRPLSRRSRRRCRCGSLYCHPPSMRRSCDPPHPFVAAGTRLPVLCRVVLLGIAVLMGRFGFSAARPRLGRPGGPIRRRPPPYTGRPGRPRS